MISEKWRLRLEARKGNEQPNLVLPKGGATGDSPTGGSSEHLLVRGGQNWEAHCPQGAGEIEGDAAEVYSLEEFQKDLADIIDEDGKVEERDTLGEQVERVPDGSKRQRPK